MHVKTKAVYFNEDEKDLLDWAEKQSNFSKYIKSLIVRDIQTEKDGIDPRMVEMVERMLETKLAGKVATENKKTAPPREGAEVEHDLIKNVF